VNSEAPAALPSPGADVIEGAIAVLASTAAGLHRRRLLLTALLEPGHPYHLSSAAHGHVACEACGSIAELPGEAFRTLAKTALSLHGFEISPARFAFPARCAHCRETTVRGRRPRRTSDEPNG